MDVTIVMNDGIGVSGETEEVPIPYEKICVPDNLWNERLQDLGCCKECVAKMTYRMNRVMPFGPKEDPLYYEHISVIVIDLMKNINLEKKEGRG